MKFKILSVLLLISCLSFSIFAGEAHVLDVKVDNNNGLYRFDVTVRHADTGWKHYANKWDVVADDGTVLGTRTLYHPHVNEQPFTRSLGNISIPPGVKTVTIRAHDLVHGYGGKTVKLDIQ